MPEVAARPTAVEEVRLSASDDEQAGKSQPAKKKRNVDIDDAKIVFFNKSSTCLGKIHEIIVKHVQEAEKKKSFEKKERNKLRRQLTN